VGEEAEIRTAKEAADHELILAFGRLQGAANRLEYILGRALEVECGISHLMFEVLLILGRAGEPGLSMRAIAQEQVLTTGGATRLVDRMEAAELVTRADSPTTGAESWCG
jgi:DNA-binding MarR family transcriptional regulator